MSIEVLQINSWDNAPNAEIQQQAIKALEFGKVLLLPNLSFNLKDSEIQFLNPNLCGKRKNISYSLQADSIGGINDTSIDLLELKQMLRRYAISSQKLLSNIFPSYINTIKIARTSFRPVEIAGRIPKSYRKDDTRLHVDAFPSNPTQGKRILRIFTNVNPIGAPRVWRVGDSFSNVVQKFAPGINKPLPGLARLSQALRLTKSRRTLYDHYMLNIHNLMKADLAYQRTVTQQQVEFKAGSTWLVYTDQVSHAAMSGQHVFEQTFYLPVTGMHDFQTSPLHTLENFLQQKLI